jgi:1,4-dihydroxy-2-naphthoate polyprenyltransferase
MTPPTGWRLWLAGARPRTLPAAVVPVAIGTACASLTGPLVWWRAAAAMVVSLALQVGVNYANDYSDGVKGTDAVRVGPLRLVGSGAVPARSVKLAAYVSFVVAACVGLGLAAVTTWWLIAVGAVAIVAAWTYTGGPKPYGYAGFGEFFVFVFFGVVATCGSAYVHHERVSGLCWALSVSAGLLSMALLVINNLRDIPTDRSVGKNTLAVRIGDARTRLLFIGCVVGALIIAWVSAIVTRRWGVLINAGAVPVAVAPVRRVRGGATGGELIPVLGGTGRVQLIVGLLTAVGVAVS